MLPFFRRITRIEWSSRCLRRPRGSRILVVATSSPASTTTTTTLWWPSNITKLWFSSLKNHNTNDGPDAPHHRSMITTTSYPLVDRLIQSELVSYSLKGTGQVIFLNSTRAGAILLTSLAVGDPYLAYLAAMGSLSSTLTAQASNLDHQVLSNGLYSYNGCLVGCATAVFVFPYTTFVTLVSGTALTITGAATATYVSAVLPSMLGRVPQWTYAFNMVTLSLLLRTKPLVTVPTEGLEDAVAVSLSSVGVWDILVGAPLKGLSQIFVVENAWSGIGVTLAIASYSPGLAAHALLGSVLGAATGGLFLDAPMSELVSGLWGFNSALTSMAIGTFFCNNRATWSLSAAGAVVTAIVFGSMKTVFGDALGSPCLTLPFCVTASGCYLLADAVPSLVLASSPHSPEVNK